MRILVVSDTHIPVAAKKIPKIILDEAKRSDFCLHAGDLMDYSVFQELSQLTKTYAVAGNMDSHEIKQTLPQKQILEFEQVKIALLHGYGSPTRLIETVTSELKEDLDKIDAIIFGHSHYSLDKEINGKFYFNPGSPTDTVFAPYKSYGILEIEGTKIKREVCIIE